MIPAANALMSTALYPRSSCSCCGEVNGKLTISRYFSANYAILVLLLAVYSLLTNLYLLFAIAFLFGGFFAISRYCEYHSPAA